MFLFEDTIEKISEAKTKEYFEEVYCSYTNGNYRSAIVMLWTVIVCDVIFKLQYLRDVYIDEKAISILDEIENKQKSKPNSPDWESELIKLVSERTNFLSPYEKLHLENVQKYRHLCAHPIITNDNILLQPTKEKVRDLLRGALEGILIKPALLTKAIVDSIIKDLAEKRNLLSDFENLKMYLCSKYFNNVEEKTIIAIFKTLWKFSINPRADEEKNNLHINFFGFISFITKT